MQPSGAAEWSLAATFVVMRRHLSPRGRPRSGLGIVEVLVALVIVTVGLLGVAGASSIALRAAREAARERIAVGRAEHRVALLRSAGCGAATSSGAEGAAPGMRESWITGAPGAGFAPLDVRVEWTGATAGRGAARRLTLLTAIPC